jgi:hypothetical protein
VLFCGIALVVIQQITGINTPIPPASTHRRCFAQYEPASLPTGRQLEESMDPDPVEFEKFIQDLALEEEEVCLGQGALRNPSWASFDWPRKVSPKLLSPLSLAALGCW